LFTSLPQEMSASILTNQSSWFDIDNFKDSQYSTSKDFIAREAYIDYCITIAMWSLASSLVFAMAWLRLWL
jgi:hypothetical protein